MGAVKKDMPGKSRERRPSLTDCGVLLPSGRVRCRYRGCRKLCMNLFGLLVHLRRCHGVSVEDVSWQDLGEV